MAEWPGAAWTSPPDRSHSQVSRTESPNGRGRSPAAFAAAHACGLLAALTADAYAAMNSHSSLLSREDRACGTDGCPREPIVELWRPDFGQRPVPACREHAVEALGQPATRIVAAYQPDVALSVFAEAHGEG